MSFPLFLDEDVTSQLVSLLEARGIDALSTLAAGRANQRLPDDEQLVFATDLGRAIVTHNVKDFEPLARQWAAAGRTHSGIILCDYRPPWQLAAALERLQEHYPEGLADTCVRLPRV